MRGPRLLGLALAAGTASYLTLLSWDRLAVNSASYLLPLFWLTAATVLTGLVLRALPLPRPAVVLFHSVVMGLLTLAALAPTTAIGGLLPTTGTFRAAVLNVQAAVEAAQQWQAPVPADVPEFAPLMILLGAAVVLCVDVLAVTLRNVPLAGFPLLAAFTAPVSIVDGVSWFGFAIAAAAYVLLLVADQSERLAPWGRSGVVTTAQQGRSQDGLPPQQPSLRDDQPHRVSFGGLLPAGAALGAAGIAAAALTPAFIPQGVALFDGPGNLAGGGEGVTINNPLVDLRRDLVRGADEPLLVVETPQRPTYWRFTALENFDGEAWRPGDRQIPEEQAAVGTLPGAPGLAARTARTEYAAQVRVDPGFDSIWLPLPYPATEIAVSEGDWRYDVSTLDVLSADRGLTLAGLEYDLTALDVDPSPAELVASPATASDIQITNTKLPDQMPEYVEQLAREVTQDSRSRFESMVMLQDWFRQDGGFVYSTDPGSGNGLEQLRAFLNEERIGYCEQFASAMALMARTLNIPARVAVGFLGADPVPGADGEWVFSSHDLHAWPEVYFEGAGWVRFEPTPQDRATAVPVYTSDPIPGPEDAPEPTAAPSAEPEPTAGPTAAPTTEDAATSDSSTSLRPFLIGAGVVLVLGALASPALFRRSLRRRRLSGRDDAGGVEDAWVELRATALDLGRDWDDTVTLRQRARGLVEDLVPSSSSRPPGTSRTSLVDPSALAALEQLVVTVERARYSAARDADGATAAVAASAVVHALEGAASPRVRRRALVLPRSLWRGRRPQRPSDRQRVGDPLDQAQDTTTAQDTTRAQDIAGAQDTGGVVGDSRHPAHLR